MSNWFGNFLSSSIGRKVIMSLTGLFLVTFLIVHLAGNLQLLAGDDGQAFNEYTYFMTHNPLIKTISYLLYAFILLHAIQGIVITAKNRSARGNQGYRKYSSRTNSWASRQMALLGILVLAFIFLHMGDFWYQMKIGALSTKEYAGYDEPLYDLYTKVKASFEQTWIVVAYLIGLIALGFHLWHGFWSAFQTLGLEHDKYTPVIKTVGYVLAIVLPLGFAIIPIVMYTQSMA